jgi:hypothetical protein
MPKIHVVEQVPPVELLTPSADSGGRTSGYLLLQAYQRATIVFHIHQGAANTILLSVLQATDEEGTSSKAITVNVPLWLVADTSVSNQWVRQTDAVSYTTTSATKDKLVAFQIDPEYLDMANGFVSIAVSTGASSASNITEAIVMLEARYAQPLLIEPADIV